MGDIVFGQRSIDIPLVQELGTVEDKIDGMQAAPEQGVSRGAANVKVVYTAVQELESAGHLTSSYSNAHKTATLLLLAASKFRTPAIR